MRALIICAFLIAICTSLGAQVIDFEGNKYEEVRIGKQLWLTMNLDVGRFQNGDEIFHAQSKEDLYLAAENGWPAWCYFGNNPANKKYGKLYNWYAVNDPRGLAPDGWHIPSDAEWKELKNYLGGKVAGKKMKNTFGWGINGNGDNSSGFSGLPGGERSYEGAFLFLGSSGYWWSSSTGIAKGQYWIPSLSDSYGTWVDSFHTGGGLSCFSVRCLKN